MEARQMKLLVKVIQAEYSDAAQIAIVDMTWEFLATPEYWLTKPN
jgi:hypothetical protein